MVSRRSLHVELEHDVAWNGRIKDGFMVVSSFISTPVQELAGVLGTVGQVQERLVRELGVQKPTEKINAQFKTPSYNTHEA
jgi:hypothetical protein